MKRLPCLLWICLLASSLPVGGRAGQTPPQVIDEMIQQIRSLETALQQDPESPGQNWQERMIQLSEPLLQSNTDLYRSTSQKGNAASTYGLRVLINELRSARDANQATQRAEELIQLLAFLRSEYHSAAGKQSVSRPRAQAREMLREILQRPEFEQNAKESVFDHYVNRLIVKVIAWLRTIFDSSAMRQAGRFAYLFLWIVYGIVGALVVWLIYRSWSPRSKLAKSGGDAVARGPVVSTPQAHLAEAEAAVRAGNFAAATRAYFLVLLATLEQREVVARNRTWTNREYVRAFAGRITDAGLCNRLSMLSSTCDAVSYGGQVCDEDRFLVFRNDVEGFLESLRTISA